MDLPRLDLVDDMIKPDIYPAFLLRVCNNKQIILNFYFENPATNKHYDKEVALHFTPVFFLSTFR